MGASEWRNFTLATPEQAREQKKRERIEKKTQNINKTCTRRRIEEIESERRLRAQFEL